MTVTDVVARCAHCHEPIDPFSRYTYTRVSGWHRPGKAGGSDISLREKHDEYLHPGRCFEEVRRGIPTGQESLL